MKKYLHLLFPLLVVILVGAISLFHRPFSSFDETNTIRIISQPFATIFKVLSDEPNFPFFYVFLKIIWEIICRNPFLLQFLYFCSYLLSGYFFFKIFTHFSQNVRYASLALGSFLSLPVVVYNASYIRMYNPALALGLGAIYLILLFGKNGTRKYLYTSIVLLVLLMLIHPIGIMMGIIVFALVISKEISNKDKITIILITLIGALGWFAQLITKTDLLRIYVSVGPKYIGELHNTFSDSGFLFHYLSMYFDQKKEYLLVGFPIFVSILYEVASVYWFLLRNKTRTIADNLALFSFILFFVISIIFGSKIYLHHMHYLLPFGIFSVAYAYLVYWNICKEALNRGWKVVLLCIVVIGTVYLSYIRQSVSLQYTTNVYPLVLALAVGLLMMLLFVYIPQLRAKIGISVQLLLFFVTILYVILLTALSNPLRCEYIQNESKINGTVFLMQHNSANFYFNCLKSYDQVILIDEKRPLFSTKGHSDSEVLTEQAIRGGSLGSFSELQLLFDEDNTLLEYNIQRLSIRPEPKVLCLQGVAQFRSFVIKGYDFVRCGEDNEYIYEKSQ